MTSIRRRSAAALMTVAGILGLGALAAPAAHAATTYYTHHASVHLQSSGADCTGGTVTLYVTWADNGSGVAASNISLANNSGRGVTKDDAWATRGSTPLEHYSRFNGWNVDNGQVMDGIQNDYDVRHWHGYPSYIGISVHATTRPGCGRTFAVKS